MGHFMKLSTLAVAAGLAALPTLGSAQGAHQGHTPPPAEAQAAPATEGYRKANATMHRDMDIRYSNDPDADFVRSMIPHHQGAIAMAEVLLQHGRDEATRRWATDIISAQKREIAEMQDWLNKRGR